MFHERFPKHFFALSSTQVTSGHLFFWLFPFLNGDREFVLHKNFALTSPLVRNILRREGFATRFDGVDVVLYTVLQLFAQASLCPAVCRSRFARSGGLKEERSILYISSIKKHVMITMMHAYINIPRR